MQLVDKDNYRVLLSLLNDLEVDSDHESADQSDSRKESRKPLRAFCDVLFFSGEQIEVVQSEGAVRNVTFDGLSIVANLSCGAKRGRPVEIVVVKPDLSRTYVAGTVAFCRQVQRQSYELGVHVKATGSNAILSSNIAAAQTTYDWFAEALKIAE